ncbi:tRNA(5-methylaminomethyl-2-thiouridylate) methyltransferase [Fundidesulfovibrio terrae]|uniref:tRNA(5-methylaminomethyl-2-thiouridylate) methyltransferase n=1 Tax=Fundidesulfovibrio terrae TaxID=2922866 RepID=UPI001FAFF19D|nr:tRNA(5-methylaminomethyl-2-thiouridylate) methyltransferase [Fundidesulfovibrio terrae]
MKQYDVLAMFSGGLDSILAAKSVAAQGLAVLGLHFTSPFFGHPDKIAGWSADYGLDIEAVDVGPEYVAMMDARPLHGVGKGLNPCVDCKILMLARCRELLGVYGAKFIVTGEVKGQRPMSQRRDALDIISRDAGVRDVLLRPLCAKTMKPTPMEESGLVDRERLHAFGGRTRKPQFRLARELGITKFPQPAGGCKLTEFESAKRYVPVFMHARPATDADFHLANVGRQFWAGAHWMAMGRNREDNETLARLARPGDRLLDVMGFPSPLGLVRALPGVDWNDAALSDAAALLASYAPKAAASGEPVQVLARLVTDAGATGAGSPGETMPWPDGEDRVLTVAPSRATRLGLADVDWEALIPVKKAMFGESQEDDGY